MQKTSIVLAVINIFLSSILYADTDHRVSKSDVAQLPSTNNTKWQGRLILEGVYIYRSSREELEIAGTPSEQHSHALNEGLQARHNEIILTGNIADIFDVHVATSISQIDEEDSHVEIELEEAFIKTHKPVGSLSAKVGRFFSALGYLSSQHNHEWDFADQPLVYGVMFGEHTFGDGLQFNYLLPTVPNLKLGTELFVNETFPSGKTDHIISALTVYAKARGDIGKNHSWQAGIGHWRADEISERSGEVHDSDQSHDHGSDDIETSNFSGDSKISTINAFYQWVPNGHFEHRYFRLQAEYFQRTEKGIIDIISETSRYKGDQSGWFIQGTYRFLPHWRIGLRHEQLSINNSGSDEQVLEEAELIPEGHTPQRYSIMLDYSPREVMRFRLQFNRDERSAKADNQIFLQYTHSFGAHDAH